MSKKARTQDHRALPATLAMTAPAVRMVIVSAWSYEEGEDGSPGEEHEIFPVLALMARERHHYRRPAAEGTVPPIAPTHEGMENEGWTYARDVQHIEYDMIVYHNDLGICDASFAFGDVENGVYEPVVCPWPPVDDEYRLADVIARLKAEARRKAEESRGPRP